MVPFSFAGQEFAAVEGGALYWPAERALLLADLHLEKASFFAGHGQMLPPYDSRETLERVERAIRKSGARCVFCLGDSFHDADGAARLEPMAARLLAGMMHETEWVWVVGNHDAAAAPAGTVVKEIEVGGLILRHEAKRGEPHPELSGHFHPRMIVRARGRRIARPCFVMSERKLILPAFGALTGGMDAADPAIIAAMGPARSVAALVAAQEKLLRYPLLGNAA